MAAITPVALKGRYTSLRSAITSTTTDWVSCPLWARLAIVHLHITTAGTNTILTLKAWSPIGGLDDTVVATILTGATITATGYRAYVIGDVGATAVADSATVNTQVIQPVAIPGVLGITTTPTGSTYNTAVEFRG